MLVKWSALIKAVRESRGWTQTELAEELGVALSTVSRWEREESAPRPRQQKVLLKFLQDQAESALLSRSLLEDASDDDWAARADRAAWAAARAALESDELEAYREREDANLDVLTKEDKELILALTRWLVSQRQQSRQQSLRLPPFDRLIHSLLEGAE